MTIYVLDGNRMTSREEAHEYIASELNFPEYYGKNLDALEDCLGDMPEDTHIEILFKEKAVENMGRYAEKIFRVFERVAKDVWIS